MDQKSLKIAPHALLQLQGDIAMQMYTCSIKLLFTTEEIPVFACLGSSIERASER